MWQMSQWCLGVTGTAYGANTDRTCMMLRQVVDAVLDAVLSIQAFELPLMHLLIRQRLSKHVLSSSGHVVVLGPVNTQPVLICQRVLCRSPKAAF